MAMETDLWPSRREAEQLLRWAEEGNPGKWADHSRVVARAAETIARAAGLGAERAYICGLLHDIGRYEGVRGLHHVVAGYELLRRRGYERVGRVCLSHSFQYQDLNAFLGEFDCTEQEIEDLRAFLETTEYDDYDRLIQLCDALGVPQGVCLMEIRLVDVVRRYGFNELTLNKWDAIYQLKARFDKLCGQNIYDLFGDEVMRVSLSF